MKKKARVLPATKEDHTSRLSTSRLSPARVTDRPMGIRVPLTIGLACLAATTHASWWVHSSYQETGSGNIEYLDRHDADCGNGNVMNIYKTEVRKIFITS